VIDRYLAFIMNNFLVEIRSKSSLRSLTVIFLGKVSEVSARSDLLNDEFFSEGRYNFNVRVCIVF